MKDKIYDNADSFAKSFDEEWVKVKCKDFKVRIYIDHPRSESG